MFEGRAAEIEERLKAAAEWRESPPLEVQDQGVSYSVLNWARRRSIVRYASPQNARFLVNAADDVSWLLGRIRELEERLASSQRLGLGAIFMADAITPEGVEAEQVAYDERLTAPFKARVRELEEQVEQMDKLLRESSVTLGAIFGDDDSSVGALGTNK